MRQHHMSLIIIIKFIAGFNKVELLQHVYKMYNFIIPRSARADMLLTEHYETQKRLSSYSF